MKRCKKCGKTISSFVTQKKMESGETIRCPPLCNECYAVWEGVSRKSKEEHELEMNCTYCNKPVYVELEGQEIDEYAKGEILETICPNCKKKIKFSKKSSLKSCNKCGKKLGFFSLKYDYKNSKGSSIKYCSKCNAEEEEKARKEIEKEQEKEKKRLDKEREEEQIRLEKEQVTIKANVVPMIINFINNSTEDKVAQLYGLYANREPFSLIDNHSLARLRNSVCQRINMGRRARTQGWMDFGTGYNPANYVEEMETCLLLLDDLEKVKTIIEKNGFQITFPLFVKWAAELIQNSVNQQKQVQEQEFEDAITGAEQTCSNCNAKIKTDSAFCKYCGAKQ